MQLKTLIPVALSFFMTAQAASLQVNFYFDTGCLDFAGSSFIDYNPSSGEYSAGGPAGSRGGLYVNSNGDGIAFRGFSNSLNGSPFTGNVVDGECIGSTGGLYAVFDV